jgi:hypothetical protein
MVINNSIGVYLGMWGCKNEEWRINKNRQSLGAAKRGSFEHAILYTVSRSEYAYTPISEANTEAFEIKAVFCMNHHIEDDCKILFQGYCVYYMSEFSLH